MSALCASVSDVLAKMWKTRGILKEGEKGKPMRLQGCPVSVAEHVLLLAGVSNAEDPAKDASLMGSYLKWKAVIAGKASIPEVPTGDDEFVELDESGKPKVEAKAKRPPPAKKRARVTKVRSKGRGRPAAEEGGESSGEGEDEAEGE